MIDIAASHFTGKKASAEVKDWGKKIQLALKYRKNFSDISNWDKYKRCYRGDFGAGVQVPVNMIYANARALIPRVYFNNPGIVVTPRRPEFAFHAQVVEAVDNNLIQETNLKYEIKKSILDTYLCGLGPLKIGFDSEFGYVPRHSVDNDGQTVTQVSTKKDGEKIEFNSAIKPGMPWVLRVKPEEIIVPFGYSDPNNLPWICHMVLRPLRDVQADQKYKKALTKTLKGGYIASNTHDVSKGKFIKGSEPRDDAYCMLFEIRDVRRGKLLTICEDQIILDEKDELQIEGIPWEFLNFNPDVDHFWGVPDVKLLMAQQTQLNEISDQEAKLRRESVLKFLYLEGTISEAQLEKLLSTDINDIGCGVEIKGEYLQNAVMTLQPSNLTSELIRQKQEVMADMRETIGFGRNQMGEMSPFHNKTAGEAKIVNSSSEIRTNERKDIVADAVSNIMRKFNQSIFKNWSDKRVVQIVGPSGAPAWIEYTGDDLTGEYFIKVDPENSTPISRELKFDMTERMFEQLREDQLVNPHELRKSYLRQFSWVDPSAILLMPEQGPQGDPNAQTPAPDNSGLMPVEEDPLQQAGAGEEPIGFSQAADLIGGIK